MLPYAVIPHEFKIDKIGRKHKIMRNQLNALKKGAKLKFKKFDEKMGFRKKSTSQRFYCVANFNHRAFRLSELR